MISLDAVDDTDVALLKTLPHFSALCRQGTLVRKVASVFVSNTYVIHTSMITGVHPEKHGIHENLWTQPGKADADWHWDSKDIKVPTLYEQAAKAGRSVCSIFYPVTCGANIRWNFPEVPGKMNLFQRAVRIFRGGTPSFVLTSLLQNRSYLKHLSEPYLDEFTTHAAARAIRSKRPDLLLLHLIDVDDHKHRFGPGSKEANAAVRRMDDRLSLLVEAMKATWPAEESAIIVFSDHGCLPVHAAVDPNDRLRAHGLIHGSGRRPDDFDAFFHNAGGTSFLKILKPEKKREIERALSELLQDVAVKRKLTADEMKISGMSEAFFCGIEAADGYCFGAEEKGQHGYSLKRENYWPFYLAAGGGVASGAEMNGGCVIDICPLAARLLGIPKWAMDGRDRLSGEQDELSGPSISDQERSRELK